MHRKLVIALVAMTLAVSMAAMPSLSDSEATGMEYDKDLGIIYSMSVIFTFTGEDAERVEWNFGDNSPIEEGFKVTHRYATIKDYYVTQTAYNSYNGGSFSTAVYKVTVAGYPWIEFESNGGSSVKNIQMNSNGPAAQAAEPPENPKRVGYTFSGWCTDPGCTTLYNWSKLVTEPVKLYAKWTEGGWSKVTFSGADVQPQDVEEGNPAVKPKDPTRDGYRFDGWFTDPGCTTAYDWSTPVTDDIILYAKWTAVPTPGPIDPGSRTYTVTFQSNGGSSVALQRIDRGDRAIEPANPTRDGYTFDGWYTDSQCTKAYDWSSEVTKSIVLYAKWSEVPAGTTYIVSFIGADMSPISIDSGKVAPEPVDPTKEGHTFDGWFTDASFTDAYDWSEPVTADIALYAKWTVQSYVLVIVYGNGTPDGSVMVPYGSPIDGYLPEDIVREGYTFDGWSDHPDTMPASKVTVTASWNPMGEDEDNNLLYIIAAALVVIALIAAIVILRRRA